MLTTLRSQISTNTKLRDLKLDMTLEHAIQDSVNMKKLALTRLPPCTIVLSTHLLMDRRKSSQIEQLR